MSTYHVEVDLLPQKTLSYVTGTAGSLSNNDALVATLTGKGHKGFFFSGGDKTAKSGCWLDGSFKFFDHVNGYPGFLGNCLSASDNTFTTEQSITLVGVSIDYLIIIFDKVAGEYATEITIGNTVYHNYSYIFIAKDLGGINTVKVIFNKWSKVNSVVKVLAVKAGLTKVYDKYSLRGIDFDNAIINGTDVMKFGIFSQTGSVTIKDDGILRALSDNNILEVGAAVRIYKDDVVVQNFISSNYENDDLNNTWDIPLTDHTVIWEDQQFAGISYASRTLKQLLDMLIPGIVHLDAAYVNSITIPASFLKTSTKWQAIVKCCTVGLLRIYEINNVVYSEKVI